MPTLKKPEEEESGEGAPLWIISFADMTSLLMAFFVMLSTFASFDQKVAQELEGIGKRIVNSGGWNYKNNYQALLAQQNSNNLSPDQNGSEKPTQDAESDGKTLKNTFGKDFRNNRIFVTESSKIFWSKGSALTAEGRNFLRTLAAFTAKIPSRIVVSEYGPDDSQIGFQRAWAAVECLVDAGVSPDECNISAQTTITKQDTPRERMFEITLIDRNIYK
jgi:flagellar motor protein MotB